LTLSRLIKKSFPVLFLILLLKFFFKGATMAMGLGKIFRLKYPEPVRSLKNTYSEALYEQYYRLFIQVAGSTVS